ncbi:unnamed protein product [Calypogeia fissa]
MEIIRQAGLERGMVVYTLADPAMAEVAKEACEHSWCHMLTFLGLSLWPLQITLGLHLWGFRGASGRKTTLSKQYFNRIDAVGFTIKQDDGALPKNLHLADLVLAGVSRTSKTPLSTYMAQKGYKVLLKTPGVLIVEHIRKELEYSRKLLPQNPRWPVIEVTGKAIEETAAVIFRLYHERRNKFSMPRISTRY